MSETRALVARRAERAMADQLANLRVAVMVVVSDPDLTWPQARAKLTEALNAALADAATPRPVAEQEEK